eukprot:scaffold10618_cov78-Skeletonema_dohrnii-CCMP3373.AAC.1
MTSLKFERPIGARADLAELNLLSSACTNSVTSKELRPDGSIRQSDISALLTSKFGISISVEEVKHVILKGLSVCDDASYFDLCEVVAALIIPELIKADKCSGDGDGASADDLTQDNMF